MPGHDSFCQTFRKIDINYWTAIHELDCQCREGLVINIETSKAFDA